MVSLHCSNAPTKVEISNKDRAIAVIGLTAFAWRNMDFKIWNLRSRRFKQYLMRYSNSSMDSSGAEGG